MGNSFKLTSPKGDWKKYVPVFIFLGAILISFFLSNNFSVGASNVFYTVMGIALILMGLWGIIVKKFSFGFQIIWPTSGIWAIISGIGFIIGGIIFLLPPEIRGQIFAFLNITGHNPTLFDKFGIY